MTSHDRIREELVFLYGDRAARNIMPDVEKIINRYQIHLAHPSGGKPGFEPLSEKDAILITYGDQISEPEKPPLQSLSEFLENYLSGQVSIIHVLPFFPYSSDDGFAIIDYLRVNPDLGSWEDIHRLEGRFSLMVDAVINHVSRESGWFKGYLSAQAPYRDYFLTLDGSEDLSQVVRPRTQPLLTPVATRQGERKVWTTFSEDQIDLNYANPQVLLEILAVLLFYVEKGVRILRLDAIAYLWKQIGSGCIHLPQTHAVIRLIRAVLDEVAPQVLLITETNVPHRENISYFGAPLDGRGKTDEAQIVYQFPLAPLVLHTFRTGDAEKLSHWAAELDAPGIFVNFIASHDGIGILPARGLLQANEIQALIDQTLAHGGEVSYRENPDRSQSVYELNITLYDFLNDPLFPDKALDVERFIATQAIMLSLAGIPGIYIHSLIGSHNCQKCVHEIGLKRSINREKFNRSRLEIRIRDDQHHYTRVFQAYRRLLQIRRQHPAFHPRAGQAVLALGPAVFGLRRTSLDGREQITCLVNVTPFEQEVALPGDGASCPCQDLLGGDNVPVGGKVRLEAYQVMWLK